MGAISFRSLLPILIFIIATATSTAQLSHEELDSAFDALRNRGYTLFPNAISTSDVLLSLVSASQPNCSFTFFSPINSFLFSVDFYSSAPQYIRTLLLHVSPRRLTASDLRSLSLTEIDSLLPNSSLRIERLVLPQNSSALDTITVNGVPVTMPDIFLGSDIAVHGLDGILTLRSRSGSENRDYSEFAPVSPPSWCESCGSPANSPENSPPDESRSPKSSNMLVTDGHLNPRPASSPPVESRWPKSPTGLKTKGHLNQSPEISPPIGSRWPKSTSGHLNLSPEISPPIGSRWPKSTSGLDSKGHSHPSPESSPPIGSGWPKSTNRIYRKGHHNRRGNGRKSHHKDEGDSSVHGSFFKYNLYFPI